jgi:hypothetical protein
MKQNKTTDSDHHLGSAILLIGHIKRLKRIAKRKPNKRKSGQLSIYTALANHLFSLAIHKREHQSRLHISRPSPSMRQ